MLRRVFSAAVLLSAMLSAPALAADLSPADQAAVDKAVTGILSRTGAPSASIAIVKDGRIAYMKAYGTGRFEPATPANPEMRYGIGSISKQFTATAILMLVDEGKLSLDDPVGKYVPRLTDGDKVTVRQILSHTSGYRDYWPQDYVMDEMLHPTTADHILDKWARIPLDFKPGDEWQYSNTGYTIAGLIVEKVSGEPLMQFLSERIFTPLHMDGATEDDTKPLAATDAQGYMRYALGPLHPAPKEGPGWLFAMGGLAMRAEDLALWDIGQIDQKLLKPASYKAQRTSIVLNGGKDSGYGLGVDVITFGKRLELEHGGEISGFLSDNQVFPDDKVAVVVLTNADFGGAQTSIAAAIDNILFPSLDATGRARAIFDGLRQGRIERAQFTSNANAYFSDEALRDFAASLGPLGEPQSFVLARPKTMRGGMTSEVYRVTYPNQTLTIIMRAYDYPPDKECRGCTTRIGKVEQFLVQPTN